jgi:hypothetical protein
MDWPWPTFEERRDLTSLTKRPIGVLGWNAKERAEHARTGQWPERTIEAPNKPPGLSISSIPDLCDHSPTEPFEGTLFDALVILSAATPKRPKPGPKSKADEDFFLGVEFLNAGSNMEQARRDFIVKLAGKALKDLSPEDHSRFSKRFTKNVLKRVRELKLTFSNASDKCN